MSGQRRLQAGFPATGGRQHGHTGTRQQGFRGNQVLVIVVNDKYVYGRAHEVPHAISFCQFDSACLKNIMSM
jgi:hypothetical protein